MTALHDAMKKLPATQDKLDALLRAAKARHDAMTPLEQAIESLEQRRGWVIAEMRMNDDASPNGRTQEQAEAALRSIAPEYHVLDALRACEAELHASRAREAGMREALTKIKNMRRIGEASDVALVALALPALAEKEDAT